MKKILLALCILLLAFPSWAASRVIQGDAQFVYSQEIDEAVNPKIGEEQEFVGFDPEGEPIYTTIPIYKYTSITSPTVTLGNVATIFPLNLDGMVFNVSYSFVSGKPGIYPGVFTFQFSKSEILMLPNGAVIMDEIENSTSPVDVLFKYFDPVFVIYGTDGDKVSINVKNFPLNFSFITGSYEDMAISFPVVLADGYPDTFCIEQVNGYLFVYDAMVSQENAGVISDGKIEVAFALVPNEKATNIARQDFPILELYEQGYVIFDDPSKYLNIPEMIGVSSAALSSGETSFVEIENGFSFTANTEAQKSATFVQCAIHSESSGIVNINGYPLETEEVLLPDGTKYLITKFVLVNGSFATGAFISGDVAYIFDGITDDAFTAEVKVTSSSSSTSSLDALFYHDRGSFHVSSLEGLENQTSDITGSFSSTTLSLLEGFTEQISPMKFEAAVDTGSSVYGIYEWTIVRSDIPNADPDLFLQDGAYAIFNYVRPILSVGDVIFDVYDYLLTNGRIDLLNVSGSLQTGFSIKVPVVLSDKGPRSISIVEQSYFEDSEDPPISYLLVSDGNEDGAVTIGSYIGVVEIPAPEPEPEPLEALFYHDRGSFYVVSLEDLENQTENISGSFTTTTLPLLEGFSEQIAPMKLDVAVDEGSSVYGVYEWTFLGTDVPGIDADAIRENINNIFNYVRPILSVDGVAFDVYDYLVTNKKTELLNISGSLQAGISIRVPVVLSDKEPRSILAEEGYLRISDGNKDGNLDIGSYLGVLEIPAPEPTLDALFYHDHGSFHVSSLEELENQTASISGSFSATSLPLLNDMVGQVAPIKFEATIDTGSSIYGVYEWSFLGTDVPNLDPNAIRENINKVFDYVRPILSVGGVAFDVYDYLATNGKPDLLSVSGSYQAGFSIKVPVVLSDKGPRSILAEGSYLHISDGAEDGNLNIGSYLGVLEISAPEPVLDVLFYLNGGSFHALSLDDLENQTTSISGGFSTVDIPLLDGMAGQVSSVKLETTIDTGSSVYGIYEWSFMGVDVPDIDANAVREDINNIFDYVRPILSVGNIVFDVYDYLAVNGKLDLLDVSGSLQTGMSISIPIVFSDKAPRNISIGENYLRILDGNEDGTLTVGSYLGILEAPAPEPEPLEALFYHDRGSFHVSSLEGLENQTENISGDFTTATLPLLEGFSEQIAPIKLEAAVDAGSSVYGIYEWSFLGTDIPDIDADAIREDINNIFDYARPILSFGGITIDVYDYLLTNQKVELLDVSGSLQAGFSIKVPVALSDQEPRGISVEENYLHILDGNKDGTIVIGSYIGILERPAPEPALNALFYHDHGSFQVSSLEGLENQTKTVSGNFASVELPLLGEITGKIAQIKLMVTVDAGSSVYGIYEWSFLGTDVPDMDVDAVREDINNIFDYVRPILSVNGIVFDVYDYLTTNNKTDLLSVSGSYQAGFSIKVPVVLSDKAPRNVSIEENRLCISDGNENGIAAVGSYIGILERPTEPTEEPLLSTQNIRLEKADIQLKLPEADAIFELGAVATWPGKEGVLAATSVGSFVGTYDGVGKYVPLKVTVSVTAVDLKTLSQDSYNAMLAAWQESPSAFFDHFHVYKQVGNFIYDLVMMGGKDAFTISGDPTTRINISFNVALVDDLGLVLFDEAQSAFIVYDGIGDGKLVDPLFIGAIALEKPEEKPTQPIISSSTMSLKLVDIDASSLGLEEAEADFEYVGLTDWPDKEGVLKAISVGSFEGEYDGTGKYVSLKMEISVTSYDLDVLSKDRHAKVISKWVEDSSAFLDYFHVYKQIGDAIYDLVMMGGKDAFTVSGDPTTRVTISFPVVLIDDVGNSYHDETMGFVIYDGEKDGKLVDPLFVGTPEQVPVEETEEDEEEVKHILPDNPEGPSTGHSDLDKWIKIFSLF